VDWDPGRPRLRVQFPAPGRGRGLCLRRLPGKIPAGLCRGLEQGHEPRPLRSRLIKHGRHNLQSILGPAGLIFSWTEIIELSPCDADHLSRDARKQVQQPPMAACFKKNGHSPSSADPVLIVVGFMLLFKILE
jgi:hypothetical protein